MSRTASKQFHRDAQRVTHDLKQRHWIQKALTGYYLKRDENRNRFRSWSHARDAAAAAKYEAINHLDKYLIEFTEKISARGTKVFWAPTAKDARQYIVDVAKAHGVQRVIKSKSMTTEEIHLNESLLKADLEVVESDLGEYIVQLRDEPPYHIVFPAMHLKRDEISKLFHEKLDSPLTDDPEELTMVARSVMRTKYCDADMGISGANFAIAETGQISITENEGNARLTTSLPKIHIALIGIEKVLPALEDLALFLPMLATAGAGQHLTCYNSLIGGPRQPGESDGPEEFHVVLLDNRRTELLADPEQRDALHCIRCGACLNVCPVYKNIGGHTYGTTYSGPIGSVLTPHYQGLQDWKHLSSASSLCGACTEVCPVKINIHNHLLHNRRNATTEKPPLLEKLLMKGYVWVMRHPIIYRLAGKIGYRLEPLRHLVNGTRLDPLYAWTQNRDLPPIASQSFHDWWKQREQRKTPSTHERP